MTEQNNNGHAQVPLAQDLVMEMLKAGVVMGHNKSKTHPKAKPFIAGNRNEIELLSPEAVSDSIAGAVAFLKTIIEQGGTVLMVGTEAASKAAVESFAQECSFPYCTVRWLGGTLTNFKMIATRLKHFDDLKGKKERGELAKYTKREQSEFEKEIQKMGIVFTGLASLLKLPEAVFVVDAKVHATAVAEAKKLRIPVIGIIDTDDNPQNIDYPIMASDHAKSSIDWVFGKLREGLAGVRRIQPVEAVPVAPVAAPRA